MVVGVENSNTEHKKVSYQRTPHAKSQLGKAFEGFMASHTRIKKRPVPKIKKNKKK